MLDLVRYVDVSGLGLSVTDVWSVYAFEIEVVEDDRTFTVGGR
jgi:hypothetical protein